ncbi:MOSC domain-containing protein [Trichophaea hybrida]|nr:MOSC domain-containing protein [Trichophaea hybrida]
MYISALYIHPIKSLLPVSIPSTTLTPLGFPHDRTFVLVRTSTSQPLQIGYVSQLCLFSLSLPTPSTLTVTFAPTADILTLPLTPPLGAPISVSLYNSPCTGYHVSQEADDFFTTHLGFETTLVFLGSSTRSVLGNVALPAPSSWLSFGRKQESKITFADVAPLLLATTSSLDEISSRCNTDVDMRKFRPNIVISPSPSSDELPPFDEDFWAEMEVKKKNVRIALTANCGRCQSINVDFETGGHVEGEKQPLKKMMKDRRVDAGLKYSPVFGRYGILVENGTGEISVSVGDEVEVTGRNEERTKFCEFPKCKTRIIGLIEGDN